MTNALSSIRHSWPDFFTNQLLRMLKLTGVFLLAASLHLSANTLGQKLTLALENVPLQKVFDQVISQTNISIIYNEKALRNAKPVTIRVQEASIQEVMEECLRNQNFSFSISGNSVIVKSVRKITPHLLFETLPPPIDVQGRVVNDKGEPVAGATVMIKGSKRATSTDTDGNFLLNGVEEKASLIITGANIENYEVNVKGQSLINVTVQQKLSPLDQVQIIAYGTTTKRLSTGSISTVKAADIEQNPVTNVLQALQGRVPGLMIEQSTGLSGGAISVKLRGQNNIQASYGANSEPLYVIDGIPYVSSLPQRSLNSSFNVNGTISALNFLNPKDIESVDVLKDADATSIYGSRAANGAILITTKRAKSGSMTFNVDVYTGFTLPKRQIDVLNTEQYLAAKKEAFRNDNRPIGPADYSLNGTWDTTRYTNWVKEMEQNPAHFTNLQTSLTGGNEFSQYSMGANYTLQETGYPSLVDKDGINRSVSLHFNMTNYSRDKRFESSLTGNYQSGTNNASPVPPGLAMGIAPDAPPIYNSDGSLNFAPKTPGGPGTFLNPFANFYRQYKGTSSNLISNLTLNYKLAKNLQVKGSFGYSNLRNDEKDIIASSVFDPASKRTGFANFQTQNVNSWIIEPQLNYNSRLGNNKINVLIGATFQENLAEGQAINADGFSNDGLLNSMQNATTLTKSGGINTQYKYNAVFGRLSYNYDNKYLLNMNLRRDGSSRFGPGKQFHTFASIGGSYIFTEEDFFQNNSVLSFGKVRASYGTAGSDNFSDYQFLDLYSVTGADIPYQGISGLSPLNQYNPDLRWQETKKLDLAIELSFFNDRIMLEGNYYRNRTGNQLVSSPLPVITGFSSIADNLPALVQNSGFEGLISTVNIKTKKFQWTSSINLSINRNKLLKFPDLENSVYKNGNLVLGRSLSVIKAFSYAGVNTQTGLYQFIDRNGEFTSLPLDPMDKTELIDVAPKYFGGLQNSINYKRFNLSFLFQFVNQIAENINGTTAFSGASVNFPVLFLARWQKPGDVAEYQKYSTSSNSSLASARISRWAYSNGSYIRLKNVSFSWNLPDELCKPIHLKNGSIFFQGQNLLIITDYKGVDPETRGTNLPPVQAWTFGLKATI
jgi:TonB-dependent starch-binding outer membrane protein SusC